MKSVFLFAVLNKTLSNSGEELKALPKSVGWLEVRADLVSDIPREHLHRRFTGRLLYTLRSEAEGGSFQGSDEHRRERLQWAVQHYDLIELEPRDVARGLHVFVPPNQRLISWRGHSATKLELIAVFEKLRQVEAFLYRLVLKVEKAEDGLAPLAMLRELRRSDVAAYGEGPSGLWSQVLAPYLGGAAIFGTVEEAAGKQDGFSVRQLVGDYGFPMLRKLERLFGIVGGRVHESLSPRVHNAAYAALNIPAIYLPFSVSSFDGFWRAFVKDALLKEWGMELDGFSLVAPHKEEGLQAADVGSALACRARAANIMVRSDGGWRADTADVDGVLLPLRHRGITLEARRVAVLGCGGSGRAAVAGLDELGALVTLVNRTEERGRKAAEDLNVAFVPLADFRPQDFSILINATARGRDGEELAFSPERLGQDATVIDFVYGANETRLVASARARGCVAIAGREILYHQIRRQFHLMTGQQIPTELAYPSGEGRGSVG